MSDWSSSCVGMRRAPVSGSIEMIIPAWAEAGTGGSFFVALVLTGRAATLLAVIFLCTAVGFALVDLVDVGAAGASVDAKKIPATKAIAKRCLVRRMTCPFLEEEKPHRLPTGNGSATPVGWTGQPLVIFQFDPFRTAVRVRVTQAAPPPGSALGRGPAWEAILGR